MTEFKAALAAEIVVDMLHGVANTLRGIGDWTAVSAELGPEIAATGDQVEDLAGRLARRWAR